MTALDGPWAEYAHAQGVALRAGRRDDRDMTPERVLDHILDRIASGVAISPSDLLRVRRSAGRRERARAALVLRHATSQEDDLRHRTRIDPERAAILADAMRGFGDLDATVLTLDARGLGGAEVAAVTGLAATAVRQRLARGRARLAGVMRHP